VEDVFFTLSLLTLPRLTLGSYFVLAAESISQTTVTCKRVDDFLKVEEPGPACHASENGCKGSVSIRDGDFGWYGQPEEKRNRTRKNSLLRLVSSVRCGISFLSKFWASEKEIGRTGEADDSSETQANVAFHQFGDLAWRTGWRCRSRWEWKEFVTGSVAERHGGAFFNRQGSLRRMPSQIVL